MTPYEVPLSPEPQTFLISLLGISYRLTVRWCAPSSCWVLNIATGSGEPIVEGIPLVTGTDLLKQYAYLGIGGALYVQSLGDAYAIPSYSDLGGNGLLFFVTP